MNCSHDRPRRVARRMLGLAGIAPRRFPHAHRFSCRATDTVDALNRKTQETLTLGGQSLTLQNAYAATGKKASQAWPDGSQVTYQWDNAQRLTEIKLPGAGSLSTQAFDAWNQAKEQLLPGGSTRTRDYDGFARLSSLRLKSPSQNERLKRTYTYDANANITAIQSERGATAYGYDSLDRLTSVSTGIDGLPNETYTDDRLGNRLTDTRRPNPAQGDKGWCYNGNNQLTESATEFATKDTGLILSSRRTVTHTYDNNGSLLQKATPAGSEADHPTATEPPEAPSGYTDRRLALCRFTHQSSRIRGGFE